MYGTSLKRLRLIYGYKAKELSELLKITPGYLSEIENNKKNPSLDLLTKYSEIFDIKLSQLIKLSEDLNDETDNKQDLEQKLIKKWINFMSKGDLD